MLLDTLYLLLCININRTTQKLKKSSKYENMCIKKVEKTAKYVDCA